MAKWQEAPAVAGPPKWQSAPAVDTAQTSELGFATPAYRKTLAAMEMPPDGAKPGSREYANWAGARASAGFDLPQVSAAPPEHETQSIASKIVAATDAGIEAIPIAGPGLLGAARDARAFIQGMPREAVDKEMRILRETNPMSSTAGAVTGTVAPFVLASTVPLVSTILGVDVAAPLALNVAAGAASQKVISHLDTLARGGDPEALIPGLGMKPEDVAGGAGAAGPIVGKAIGAAASKFGEAVVDPVVRAFRGVTGQADDAAQAAIARTIAADANSPTALTAMDEAAAAASGQPLINADRFGTATRQLARTSANADPQAREMLSEFVQDRFLTQNDRARDWIVRNTGAPTNVFAVQQNATSAAKAVNNAAYKTAYSQPAAQAIWTPELEQLMQSENFRSAIKAAIKTSSEEAALSGSKPIQNPFVFNQLDDTYRLRIDPKSGTPIEPTLQFWDHVQRALRRRGSQLGKSGELDYDAGQVLRARAKLNEVLDATVPEFAQARGGAARWFGAEDALEAGQKFTTMKLSDMDAARDAFAKFSPTDKRMFASGFSASLLDKIGATPDSVNVINKIFASPQARAQIDLVLGPKAAAELEPFLRVENAMQMTKTAVQGGSNTVQQLLALGIKTGGTNAGVGYGTGAAFGGLDPRNWGSKAWTAALIGAAGKAGISALGKKVDANVMQSIAKLLASDDPKLIEQAIQRAARSPQAAEALRAIENGLSMLVRGTGAGAASGAALEGTSQ